MTKTIFGISIVAAALACGCASNPTRSTGVVALEIPEPPPKPDILPAPAPEAPPERPAAAAPAERPPSVPAARPTPPPQSGNAGAAPTPPAPVGPVAATPEATPPTPAAELRPAGTAARSLTSAQVRESLDRTNQKLNAIDRRRLNAGKRADYDSARRFLAQADTAVKANNLLLAQSSVEKAEALANGLR